MTGRENTLSGSASDPERPSRCPETETPSSRLGQEAKEAAWAF